MPLDLSYDPLAVPATSAELQAARIVNMEAPITVSDGKTFQYADTDERTMRKALVALEATPGLTINWRLLDNSEVPLDAAQISGYLAELDLLQAQRGMLVDAEYMTMKSAGNYTRRDLATWRNKYATGYIPELS